MTRIRWITSIVFVVAIAIGVLLAVNLGGDPTKVSNPTVHQRAPDFKLTTFDNKQIHLAQLQSTSPGKVVLVNFWNDWCAPCQAETGNLVALANAHKNDDQFALVGIVHDPQTKAAAMAYAAGKKMTYPLAFDQNDKTGLDYGVTGQPESFLIDKRGIVDEWISGPLDAKATQAMENRIEALEAQ